GCTTELVEALQPLAQAPARMPVIPARSNPPANSPTENSRTVGGILDETPRPAALHTDPEAPSRNTSPARPSRQPLPTDPNPAGPAPASSLRSDGKRLRAPSPETPPTQAPDRESFRGFTEADPQYTGEERLGPLGIAFGAIAVCALAWL